MFIAEREGFEPPEPFSSTVFKTAVIDHSTISPILNPSGVSPKRIAKIDVFYETANFFAKISVWIFKKNCCGLSGGGGSVFLQEKLTVEEQKVEGTDRHATVSEVEYCAEEGVDGI